MTRYEIQQEAASIYRQALANDDLDLARQALKVAERNKCSIVETRPGSGYRRATG